MVQAKKFGLLVVLAVAMTGCGVDESQVGTPDETQTTADELRKLSPCATVRCAAGTHCVSRGQRASCVPDSAPTCNTDSDCRLFSNYCEGCACQALPIASADPTCTGTTIACFADPCGGRFAACVSGSCTLQ